MKRTLYIPDDLWAQLNSYLQQHPRENASSVVQVALRDKLRPRNGARLLELTGIVENASPEASTNKNER
jgi:metal-responsive CopG/Arc/MetJ family transcriptional regulator